MLSSAESVTDRSGPIVTVASIAADTSTPVKAATSLVSSFVTPLRDRRSAPIVSHPER